MLRDRIESLLKTLTYREREIIKLRYGLGDGQTYTLEEVGKMFNVTRERVRQIEAKAVRKLQHPVRARKLEGFLEGLEGKPEGPPVDGDHPPGSEFLEGLEGRLRAHVHPAHEPSRAVGAHGQQGRVHREALPDAVEEVPFGEAADLVVINTCTVTGYADRESRQLVHRARRANPDARIVVTGCLADRSPEQVRLEGVLAVVDNAGNLSAVPSGAGGASTLFDATPPAAGAVDAVDEEE